MMSVAGLIGQNDEPRNAIELKAEDMNLEQQLQQAVSQAQPQPPPRPTRKRRRTVISCTECHRRKQKCDRNLPCSNCVDRGKVSICRYESDATIVNKRIDIHAHPSQLTSAENGGYGHHLGGHMSSDSATQQLSALGYSREHGNNALAFVEKIQLYGKDGDVLPMGTQSRQDSGLREKYKDLIRQLPSRSYIELLIEVYFREINWHYCPLDRLAFDQHLQGWWNVSFSVINKGPQELPADLRFFPALLFQVLALALQFQPPGQDSTFDALKYVKEMTLDDLASDYSESGAAILNILGKRQVTLVTVQAGFCRTSFLKNSGSVPEAWHCLGSVIRDGQEIMLHKNAMGSLNRNGQPEKLDHLWHTEDRRRMWTILSTWDSHMALVLGRPTTIDYCRDDPIIFPVDVSPTLDRKISPPVPRSSDEPPTPLTMAIANGQSAGVLREILTLERYHFDPNDPSKLEQTRHIHDKIKQQLEDLPPYFRSENPDTTFDDDPSCYWLPESRPLFDTFVGFAIMCVHRPYIFTVSNSRSEALKAALTVLRAQRDFFTYLQTKHYKMFNLVLSTFDAIVMAAAIYTIFPAENPEHLEDALQQFEWAMERFETMSERNQMAKAALGVLQAIYTRLKVAISRPIAKRAASSSPHSGHSNTSDEQQATPATSNITSTSNTSPEGSGQSVSGTIFQSSAVDNSLLPGVLSFTDYPPMTQKVTDPALAAPAPKSLQASTPYAISTSMPDGPGTNGTWDAYTSSLQVPQYEEATFNFDSMAPLQPMHDLLFNDLVGMPDAARLPNLSTNSTNYYEQRVPWQFDGGFKNDSFWNYLNQYHSNV